MLFTISYVTKSLKKSNGDLLSMFQVHLPTGETKFSEEEEASKEVEELLHCSKVVVVAVVVSEGKRGSIGFVVVVKEELLVSDC